MTNSELELWNKVRTFQFDKPNIKLTFAKRLAKENAIPEHFANRIIDEYRKFVFLCCVSKGQIAPSNFVDQAWHLHLTYTRSYWVDLCKNTINRDLHHNPTEGGKDEDAKFKDLYRDTLDLYRSYFSSDPPGDIWPDESHKLEDAVVGIDKSKNWVIPKPHFSFHKQRHSFSIIGIVFLALLLGCTSYTGAIPILVIFAIIIAIAVWVIRKNNGQKRGGDCSGCGSGCGGGGDSSGGDSGCSSGCSGGCGGGGD